MPTKSKTATSTPRLSEYARAFVFPGGIKKTVWPRVAAKGKELGDTLTVRRFVRFGLGE